MVDHCLPSEINAKESDVCSSSTQKGNHISQPSTEHLREIKSMVSDVSELRRTVTERFYTRRYFRVELEKRLESISHPAKAASVELRDIFKRTLIVSIQSTFE